MTALRWLSLSVLFLTGCYDARVPLGSPEESRMDSSLVGRWVPAGGLIDGELALLRILPFNEHEYYLEYWSQSDLESFPEISRIRGFETEVGEARFANLHLIEDDEEGYMLAQFEITDEGLLGIRMVDRDMKDIETSEALYQVVAGLLESGELQKEEMVYFEKQNP